MLPVYLGSHDARRAWQMGAAAVLWTGIIKLVAAPFAGFDSPVDSAPGLHDSFRGSHVQLSRYGAAATDFRSARRWTGGAQHCAG